MKKPFTVEDLYLHQKITELDSAPGVAEVACTVRRVDRQGDRYRSQIWRFPLDGRPPAPLTQGRGTDNTPRWSPDASRLAFISDRGGLPQVHLLAAQGGEARQAGDFSTGASGIRWFPDGKSIGVLSGMTVNPDLRGERPGSGSAAAPSCAPEVAWKLPYKSDGVGYLLQREIRLFRLDVASGEQFQLTDGAFDVLGFDVSPDGRQIAYSRTRAGRFAHCTELWVCNTDGSRHRPLVQDMSTVAQPLWSRDGGVIAFTGAVKEGEGQCTLWLYDCASGQRSLFLDEAVEVADGESMHWSSDRRHLVFSEAFRGRHRLVAASLQDRTLEVLAAGDRQYGVFGCNGDRLVYSIESPVLPSELWVCAGDGTQEAQISHLNTWWNDRTEIYAELRSFSVPNGCSGTEQIEGWLLRSAANDGGGPLLNDVHGGPASYALMDFDSNVFWQVLCSQGWSVLALNAVGSSSYGRRFCDRLAGHWGEYDLPQHLAAVRQLQAEGVCGGQVAISGKSYGGYLSAWAIGHTDVFRAAVVMAPVGNIEAHYGTSDGGYYADPFYLGTSPAFNRQLARQLSPLQFVEQAKTPTLFLQGKDDERCPKCQSEELFVSLLRAGETPTELVLYPGENHSFLGQGAPACRADAAQRIVDWLTEHAVALVDLDLTQSDLQAA